MQFFAASTLLAFPMAILLDEFYGNGRRPFSRFLQFSQKIFFGCPFYSMSTECAVLFGGNFYVCQFFPLGGTTVYGRRLYKVTLAPSIGTTKHDAS
jgi:hypothetical protein